MTNKNEMVAPIGFTVIWGPMKSGKTIAALNSPYRPVLIIDTENSAHDYEQHMDKLIESGLLRDKFTRINALTYGEAQGALKDTATAKERWGTVILDTGGQYTTWLADHTFHNNAKQAEKMSQVVWGKVRDKIRREVLWLQTNCSLLIYTAHSRTYQGVTSPRINPSAMELASVSVEIRKQRNQASPNAQVTARLPFFPPRIAEFSMDKLLAYVDKPANWDNLKEEEKEPEAPPMPPPHIPEDN